jgi:hypothetical protein
MGHSVIDLRSNLIRGIENIPAQMLKDTFLNFQKRGELLVSAGGVHSDTNKIH